MTQVRILVGASVRALGFGYPRRVFESLWSLIKGYSERLAMFIFGLEPEREPSDLERAVGRFLEVVANLAVLAMVLSLIIRVAWEGLSKPEVTQTMEALGWSWALQHVRELALLILLAAASLLGLLTLLFWLRHVLSPSRLLTLWAIFELGRVGVRLWTADASWKDVLEKLAG